MPTYIMTNANVHSKETERPSVICPRLGASQMAPPKIAGKRQRTPISNLAVKPERALAAVQPYKAVRRMARMKKPRITTPAHTGGGDFFSIM